MKLEQLKIVDTALALVDAQGLDKLSMRALAEALKVQASALYWHVGDKAELISLMANTFYRAAFEATPSGIGWRPWLLGYGHAFRHALLSHRDSARLCAIAKPLQEDGQIAVDRLVSPLVAGGLDRHTALSYQASVISFALGWAIYQQNNALHDHLAKVVGFDESFEIGLSAMIEGFPDPRGA